jgi:hypothetical protein
MLQVLTTLHLKDGFDLHRAEYQLLLRLQGSWQYV